MHRVHAYTQWRRAQSVAWQDFLFLVFFSFTFFSHVKWWTEEGKVRELQIIFLLFWRYRSRKYTRTKFIFGLCTFLRFFLRDIVVHLGSLFSPLFQFFQLHFAHSFQFFSFLGLSKNQKNRQRRTKEILELHLLAMVLKMRLEAWQWSIRNMCYFWYGYHIRKFSIRE